MWTGFVAWEQLGGDFGKKVRNLMDWVLGLRPGLVVEGLECLKLGLVEGRLRRKVRQLKWLVKGDCWVFL